MERDRRLTRQSCCALLAAAASAALLAPTAFADRTWDPTIPSGNWNTPSNWLGNAVPTNVDNVTIAFNDSLLTHNITYNGSIVTNASLNLRNTSTGSVIFNVPTGFALQVGTLNLALGTTSGSAQVNQTGGSVTVSTLLDIAGLPGASGLYSISGGTLSGGSNSFVVGDFSIGSFSQSGGLVSTANLALGSNPTGTGVYALSGSGVLTVSNNESLGDSGKATFNQTGGSHTIASNLYLGFNSTANAVYNLSGAAILNANTFEYVGYSGKATFSQTGGSHTVSSLLYLGFNTGAVGNYNLSSGNLTVLSSFVVGNSGLGSFSQTGGTNTVQAFYLAANGGATGIYTLNGAAALLTSNTYAEIGGAGAGGGTGILNIQAGTMHVATTFKIWNTGATAVNLSGGLLSVGTLDTSGNPSRFTSGWTGGTLALTGLNGLTIDPTGPLGNNISLVPGKNLSVTNDEFLGVTANSTFTHTGGTHQIMGAMSLGTNNPAIYNLSGTGLLVVNAYEIIGDVATNTTFNQTGGTNITNGMKLGDATPGLGVYNLGAGSLSVQGLEYIADDGSGGIAIFNQTGGTHTIGTALANQNLWMSEHALDTASYLLNGAAALFTVNGSAYVGGRGNEAPGGTGIVTIQAGTMNVTSTLKIWNTPGTAVNLTGGVLNVGTLDTTGNPSRLLTGWNGGTLNITGLGGLTLNAAGPFGTGLSLANGQNLGVTNNLNIPVGSEIDLNGGLLTYGSLALAGGTIGGSGALINNSLLTGFGAISTANFTNNSQLLQSGGDFTVSSSTSFTNAGTTTLELGRQLNLTGANLTNHGLIYLSNANINGTAQLNNFSDGTVSGPGNINVPFTNAGTLLVPDGITKAGSFTNSGVVELAGNAATLGPGGTITNSATIEGHGKISDSITNNATIEALGGTLVLAAPLTNSGILRSGASTKILIQGAGNFPTNAGLISLVGGTIDTGGQTLNNTGQISGYGVLATGGLTNNNIMVLTGGTTTVNGPVTNSLNKTLLIKNDPALFTGPVTNNGTIKTTNTIVTFTSNYTGNAYISDPSTNIFSANVTITPGGSMTGALGDQFILTGSSPSLFTNNGTFTNGGFLSSSVSAINTGTFTQTGAQSWSPNTTFTNSGTATFGSDTGAASTFNLNLHLTAGTVTLNSPEHLASLVIDSAGTSFAGTVDLKNNYLLLGPGNSSSTLRAYLLSGITNGTGLKSTSATAAQALGYADASVYNILHPDHLFQGQTLAGTELLTKFTWQGDADLSGYITMNDYAQLEAGFFFGHFNGNAGNNPASWAFGDFNYDGLVNVHDYALIDNAFHLQSGTLASDLIEQHSLQFGSPYLAALTSLNTIVPEPASLALLSLAIVPLLRRRSQLSIRHGSHIIPLMNP